MDSESKKSLDITSLAEVGTKPRTLHKTFKAYQLNIHTLTPDELNVFMKWDRKTPLSKVDLLSLIHI